MSRAQEVDITGNTKLSFFIRRLITIDYKIGIGTIHKLRKHDHEGS